MTVLAPRDPLDADPKVISLRIGGGLLKALDKVADEHGYSRAELVNDFLKWALRTHLAEVEAEKKSGKKDR